MAVSMMALLRLALLSVLFGGLLVLSFRALRLPLCLFSPRGVGEWRGRTALRFLSDFFLSVLVSLSFCVFLFWQADGIPRLFVFAAAALGALFVARPLAPLLDAAEGRLILLVRRFAATVLRPPLLLLIRLCYAGFSVLRKIAMRIIKRVRKHYTNLVSVGYRRREPKRTEGRRIRARIAGAIHDREEGYGERR